MDLNKPSNNGGAETVGQTDAAAQTEASPASESDGQHKPLLELTEDKAAEEQALAKKKRFWKEVREWVIMIAVTLLVVFLVRSYVFEPIAVQGPSMNDTLFSGDRMFVTKFDYLFGGEPERGQVVICHYPGKTANYVKRLIAVPGDTIEIRAGVTYINGIAQDESYIAHQTDNDFAPVTLGEDQYFVMGDNRANSNDCRRIGPLSKSQIIGRARFVFWPFNKFGSDGLKVDVVAE